MAQTTSSGWNLAQRASYRLLAQGVLMSLNKTTASGINFFTIGSSLIGGNDIIKAGNANIAYFDQYLYNDYTPYVLHWAVDRQLGQFPYGIILAQADVELDNTANNFTPNFSPTVGSGIVPGRPFKLSVGFNGELMNQFVGLTGQPEVSLSSRKIVYHAFDALDYIKSYAFTTSGTPTSVSGMLINKFGNEIMDYCLSNMGFTPNQYVLDQSLQPKVGFSILTDRKVGDIFQDLLESEQGILFVDENGIIRFWNRQHFTTVSGLGSAFNLNYNNIISLDYENAPVINDVRVKAKARSLQSKQKVFQISSALVLAPKSVTTFFADFTDSDGELPVTQVDTPVAQGSAVTSYYVTNSQIDGSGSAVDSQVAVASVYLFGKTYRINFQNTGNANAFITDMALFGTPAPVTSVIDQHYSDATSIAMYGRNPANNGDELLIENNYIQDFSTAYTLAYTLVNEYKNPLQRYKATIFANPALQIGDYGTLNATELGNRFVYITGIRTIMDTNANLLQELTLEQRTLKHYFQIGSSAIQGTDEIAP